MQRKTFLTRDTLQSSNSTSISQWVRYFGNEKLHLSSVEMIDDSKDFPPDSCSLTNTLTIILKRNNWSISVGGCRNRSLYFKHGGIFKLFWNLSSEDMSVQLAGLTSACFYIFFIRINSGIIYWNMALFNSLTIHFLPRNLAITIALHFNPPLIAYTYSINQLAWLAFRSLHKNGLPLIFPWNLLCNGLIGYWGCCTISSRFTLQKDVEFILWARSTGK